MELFLLGLISSFFITLVTSTANALVKRLFDETQKPPPKTQPNVTVVVVYVFIV